MEENVEISDRYNDDNLYNPIDPTRRATLNTAKGKLRRQKEKQDSVVKDRT